MTPDPVLEKDSDLRLPGVTVLRASAGSGKTHSLTKRLVQLLISNRIPHNDLCQVLALTFSNNAAREMRDRALQWLKDLYFGDARALSEIGALVSLDRDDLVARAGHLIEEILDRYTDFQVRTIDSFMTSVFKASAIDLGYAPEFEIMMEGRPLTEYAFDDLLRDVRAGSEEADLIAEIIDDVQGGRGSGGPFIWDPANVLLQELDQIDTKLASRGKTLSRPSLNSEKRAIETRILSVFGDLQSAVQAGLRSGLALNSRSSYEGVAKIIRGQQGTADGGGLADLSGKGMKLLPVKKYGKDRKGREAYEEIERLWRDLQALVSRYTSVLARSHYEPFVQLYQPFAEKLGAVKRRFSQVFIGDISRVLAGYLDASLVPDVYLRLGDRVFHYLIDEFQDTSPVQWRNLFPLIEESLSKGGSLFVVGDTKQAIYAFRDTDYRIMRRLETEQVFPAASHGVKELDTNYRSTTKILDLTDHLFLRCLGENGIPETPDDKERMDTYRTAARESGLADYVQRPRPDAPGGHAEITIMTASVDDPPERQKILEVIDDLRRRGYRFGEIAVLAPRNEDVVRITGWLSDNNIPFLSFSSLDVRRRKLTGEIFSLLRFLDSPVDDASFASFLLGDVFATAATAAAEPTGRREMADFVFRHRKDKPLYKAFQAEFPLTWDRFFSPLFKRAGYLPLYDLLSEVYAAFSLFTSFAAEEATLAKVLDAVTSFEGQGMSNLRQFLDTAEAEDEGPWVMDVPPQQDAVKVMTIHKSKGLGFPAVITVVYEKQVRIDNRVLEEDDNGEVNLVKVTKSNAAVADDLSQIYESQLLREYVNSLNTLYVGVTRAKEELYVIGLRKDDAKTPGFPVDILASAGFPPAPVTYVRPAPREADAAPDAATTHAVHPPRLPAAPDGDLSIHERQRGIFIHRVLRDISWRGDLARLPLIIAQAQKELGYDAPVSEIGALITRLLDEPALGPYFDERPGRSVMIEREFADRRGALYRMDRVVVDPEEVVVIDFKTGGDAAKADYDAQVGYYMAILRPLFPGRTVRGLIAYVDGPAMREVP